MTVRINAKELAAMGRGFITAGQLLPRRIDAALPTLIPGIEFVATSAIRARTPVSEGHPFYPDRTPGTLAKATEATSTISGSAVLTETAQDARSGPNLDGTGGGFPYVLSAWKGRRGFSMPSGGPTSTGKRMALTPWGPRPAIGPASGSDYPGKATPEIASASRLLLQHWSIPILEMLLEAS